jgi:ribosomal protein S18 acetylase RimI-like enzyme
MFDALQAFEREIEPNRLPPAEAGPHFDHLMRWSAEGGFILIAEDARGAPAGMLIAGRADEGAFVLPRNRPHGEVSDLWVAPAARRQGLATRLLAEAERRFRAAGLRRMTIAALAANAPAAALYRRWAGGPHAVLYARDLDPADGAARD